MRRNMGPDVYINDKLIPSGSYVVYPFSDVHLDPEIYPNPWRFDPSRKEVSKIDLAYVGWGVGQSVPSFLLLDFVPRLTLNLFTGKTTCLGTRLAKVELKLTTALFLLGFDHEIVDKTGAVPDSLPKPNWNDILLCRPPPGSCYVKYKRTHLSL